MLIAHEKKTGAGQFCGMIEYVTNWNAAFGSKGQMRFYSGKDLPFITDIALGMRDGKREYICYVYDHCDKDIVLIANEKSDEIVALVDNAKISHPDRNIFTVNLADKPVLLTTKEFESYYPEIPPRDELFIFDAPEGMSGGFPKIFMYQKHHRSGTYGDVFPVFVQTSSMCFDAVNGQTPEGKEFTYNLVRAYNTKVFELSPSLTFHSISFPTNGKQEMKSYLKLDALNKFADNCGAEKLVLENGKVVFKDDGVEIPVEDESEETPDTKEAIDNADQILKEMFGMPATSNLAEWIQKQAMEKDTVKLSEIFQYGLASTLVMLNFRDTIIDVEIDVPGMVRKMCLFEGQFHLIPLMASGTGIKDILDFFGEEEELFHICDEENYPKKFRPSLPAPQS